MAGKVTLRLPSFKKKPRLDLQPGAQRLQERFCYPLLCTDFIWNVTASAMLHRVQTLPCPNTLQGLPLCRGPGKDGGWFSVSRWLGALSWTWPEEKGWMLRATASLYAGQKQTSSAGSPVPIEKPSCGVAVAGRVGDWGSGAR